MSIKLQPEEKYTEENAAIIFELELMNIYHALGKKSFLIIFDEIERIAFKTSFLDHWATGLDFVFFWQTVRSLFQKMDIFTLLLIGTNPMCVENPTIYGKDNPLFNQLPFDYIPGFDYKQTREMVRTLGRLMGLKFDEGLYSKLTDDFGGHPYLIRHICSEIHKMCSQERPIVVNKVMYDQAKQIFVQKYSSHIEMILTVLQDYYNEEFSMLEYLARGDTETFNNIANELPNIINHLLGYGIIEKLSGFYVFKIEAVKEYLEHMQKYQKINQTVNEMWAEISERRNQLEVNIRLIVKKQLVAHYGKAEAKLRVIDILGGSQKNKLAALSYEELFDPNISKIFFLKLKDIIVKNWEAFKFIFPPNEGDFEKKMTKINELRKDAHGKPITKAEMSDFRENISEIEQQVEDFL